MGHAENAADAVQHLTATVNEHGFDHADTHAARDAANAAVDAAHAAGVTNEDIRAARR
ncbi:hypothetical protein [Streptomyces chrestomyceticus]|uniref:hypothetical protein n=1 Tax=Streptomyces chrestomyceticus TaxID=68185 RepID=UPI0035A8FC9E